MIETQTAKMSNFITPKNAKSNIPLLQPEKIQVWRHEIGEILQGRDQRLLLIVGPCSIHNVDAAKAYAERLKLLAEEVQDVFFIAMRAYFEKPRTSLGWKGLLYDPYLDGSNDMQTGIHLARSFLSDLTELGLAAATEFLEPLSAFYLSDFISWGSIGARTCQSPIHRQLASFLPMPVGFKNRSDGNVDIAIQAIITSRQSHHFLGIDEDGHVSQVYGAGNQLTHLVLRGGENHPNYDRASIEKARLRLQHADLIDRLIVDCSHDNSQRNYREQTKIFSFLINQIASGNKTIRGIMLESFILAGVQDQYFSKELAASLTDPCLDWETTEQIICQGADVLRQKVTSCV